MGVVKELEHKNTKRRSVKSSHANESGEVGKKKIIYITYLHQQEVGKRRPEKGPIEIVISEIELLLRWVED
mgnify:CR=1 FL=1